MKYSLHLGALHTICIKEMFFKFLFANSWVSLGQYF